MITVQYSSIHIIDKWIPSSHDLSLTLKNLFYNDLTSIPFIKITLVSINSFSLKPSSFLRWLITYHLLALACFHGRIAATIKQTTAIFSCYRCHSIFLADTWKLLRKNYPNESPDGYYTKVIGFYRSLSNI